MLKLSVLIALSEPAMANEGGRSSSNRQRLMMVDDALERQIESRFRETMANIAGQFDLYDSLLLFIDIYKINVCDERGSSTNTYECSFDRSTSLTPHPSFTHQPAHFHSAKSLRIVPVATSRTV